MRIWLRRSLWIVAGVFLLALVNGIYHTNKALPEGLSFEGPERQASDVRFLRDLTFVDKNGSRQVEQEIFDAVFEMIRGAQKLILVDMFLFNDFQGATPEKTRQLCRELTDELLARKKAVPEIEIHVITDPINTVYGGVESAHLSELEDAGVVVTLTDLARLRDSNPLYSSFWRIFIKPFGNSEGAMVPNPFGGDQVSLRSYFALLNFKANHRKTVVADSLNGFVGLVMSANPHDGSSAHENVAIRFNGEAVVDLLRAEEAVLRFSIDEQIEFDYETFARHNNAGQSAAMFGETVSVRVLGESKIKHAAIGLFDDAKEIDLAMFYLSDREIVRALTIAAENGATVRLILDPNKDAFGHQKGGVPNRQVASELIESGNVEIRWADTHGEQCHSKMLLTRDGSGNAKLLLGSANYTRRNFDDLNLELDVLVSGSSTDSVFLRASEYFEMTWNNDSGRMFTTDYETYRDDSGLKKLKYRFMERTGVSTF